MLKTLGHMAIGGAFWIAVAVCYAYFGLIATIVIVGFVALLAAIAGLVRTIRRQGELTRAALAARDQRSAPPPP